MFKRKAKSDKAPKAKRAKKPKKARAKKSAGALRSPADSIALKKQAADIYTIMLIISLVAVLIACILLFAELQTYGSYPWWNAG